MLTTIPRSFGARSTPEEKQRDAEFARDEKRLQSPFVWQFVWQPTATIQHPEISKGQGSGRGIMPRRASDLSACDQQRHRLQTRNGLLLLLDLSANNVQRDVDIVGVASSILATPTIDKPRFGGVFCGYSARGQSRAPK